MNPKYKSSLLLTFTAIIWGVAFVAQSEGSNHFGSCSFTGIRFLIASAVLLPFIRTRRRESLPFQANQIQTAGPRFSIWGAGIICGLLLAAASLLQQEGIALGTGAGKAGFLTAVYIVLVPLVDMLLFKKRTPPAVWAAVALALPGLYFLCIKGEFIFRLPDLLLLASALLFAFQILSVSRFSPLYDPLRLAAIEFFVCGLACSLLMVPIDIIPVGFKTWLASFNSPAAWVSLGYLAILSGAVGYTLQIVGQRGLNPTVASLIMSTESVFAALAGWFILRQAMTLREIVGAALLLVAVVLSQLPERSKDTRK